MMFEPGLVRDPGPFRVGDRVLIPYVTEQVEGTVVHDYGKLGKGGERLYDVRVRLDDVTDEMVIHRGADDLKPVARAPEPERKKRANKRREE